VRLTVQEGNPFSVGIRFGRACNSMPRKGSIGTMISSGPCGDLVSALFVATVHIGFEGAQRPLRCVSKPEFLGCRSE
jgi:hypothetical protein